MTTLLPVAASQSAPRATTQNVLEVVRLMRGELRKSDRKVADLVLADPNRILNATVAETAAAAGVSEPTVIRFCAAIGCNGFQDFKLRLAQSIALGTRRPIRCCSIPIRPKQWSRRSSIIPSPAWTGRAIISTRKR